MCRIKFSQENSTTKIAKGEKNEKNNSNKPYINVKSPIFYIIGIVLLFIQKTMAIISRQGCPIGFNKHTSLQFYEKTR